jgi:chromosome segregation ATPase
MSRRNQAVLKSTKSRSQFKFDLVSDVLLSIIEEYPKNYSAEPGLSKIPQTDTFRTLDSKHFGTAENIETPQRTPNKLKKTFHKKGLLSKSSEKDFKINKIVAKQDEIIKYQNNIIEDLKKRLDYSEYKKKDHKNENYLKFENFELNKKIDQLKKEYEQEFIKIRKGIDNKEENFKEFKIAMLMKLKKKKMKIQLLKKTVSGVKQEYLSSYESFCKSALQDLNQKLEKENREKLLVEENLSNIKEKEKILIEENNILTQNYEDIQKKFNNLEMKFFYVNQTISKNIPEDKKNMKFDDYIMHLNSVTQQNNIINEKCKSLVENNLEYQLENKMLKLKVLKLNKKLEDFQEKNKSSFTSDIETLLNKLQRKKNKISELKQKILELKNRSSRAQNPSIKNNVHEDPSDLNDINNPMFYIEHELDYLKTENKLLSTQEKELNNRLKISEKAKFFYQEQANILNEKLNSLESPLKVSDHVQAIKSNKNSRSPKKFARNSSEKDIRSCSKTTTTTPSNS